MVEMAEREKTMPVAKARVAMPARDLGWRGKYCFSNLSRASSMSSPPRRKSISGEGGAIPPLSRTSKGSTRRDWEPVDPLLVGR